MDAALADIRAFVSGDLSPGAFRDRVYSREEFQQLLENDPRLSVHGYVRGSVYQFLLGLDFDDIADVLNAQVALVEFMDRNGYAYTPTDKYKRFHRLILKAQPAWANVSTKYVQEKVLPEAGDLSGKALESWLKAELRKRFRYAKKPPKWIQSPNWPTNENGPLVFLGQVNVADYFHDSASVYVFHDQATGKCETVIQVY